MNAAPADARPRSRQAPSCTGPEWPLTVWFWAAYLMATHSNGISALQLQKQLGLGSYKNRPGSLPQNCDLPWLHQKGRRSADWSRLMKQHLLTERVTIRPQAVRGAVMMANCCGGWGGGGPRPGTEYVSRAHPPLHNQGLLSDQPA